MNLTQYIESKRDDHLSELFEFCASQRQRASDHKPGHRARRQVVANRLGAAGWKMSKSFRQ